MATPKIEIPTILTIDQSAALARYQRGEGPAPVGIPGFPPPSAPPVTPSATVQVSGRKFPWWGYALAAVAVVGVVVLVRRRR